MDVCIPLDADKYKYENETNIESRKQEMKTRDKD
jgi:hypothetical protein